MRKKTILFVTGFVVFIVGFVIYDQMKYTTYGEIMEEWIGEEEIVEMKLHNTRKRAYDQLEGQEEQIVVESPEKMIDVIDESSDMVMKRNDEIPIWDYEIRLETKEGNEYVITLGYDSAQMYDTQYEIPEEDNRLHKKVRAVFSNEVKDD
ncbi:hypothetical protein [Salisediminibacterium beveridgei]|uniref:Uncharacterized protein n=1 Tax=Salisediminibacterium beveridgei TaxID=632773 RepID=A0A1D7QXZ0_9BACI|nr:hypothetical protein [Salisediminibacterium beveridgei]AOM83876.1 hypothetical protein BBEV_2537 [Salisediminibacterium beveridgei]